MSWGRICGCEEKVAQEGIQALYYGLAAIQSGHDDVVLVLGHCKESQGQSRNMVTHVAFDPFYTRPVGLDFSAAAGTSGPGICHQAPISPTNNWPKSWPGPAGKARMNPATPETAAFSREEVHSICHAGGSHPGTARLSGFGWRGGNDSGRGRSGAENLRHIPSGSPGWATAWTVFFWEIVIWHPISHSKKPPNGPINRAGIMIRHRDIRCHRTLRSVCLSAAHVDGRAWDLWTKAKAAHWIDGGGPDSMNVNLSGGMLAGNPLILGGLVRAAEVSLQLRERPGTGRWRMPETCAGPRRHGAGRTISLGGDSGTGLRSSREATDEEK